MDFQRARSEEQKQSRLDEIVRIASVIFDKEGFDNLNLTAIADQAGFTRPAIYRYFPSKEAILLRVMTEDFDEWSRGLTSSFDPERNYTIDEITDIWASSNVTRERMLKLYSIFNTVIEKNLSVEALTEFEKSSIRSMRPVKELLYRLFPKATEGQIKSFLDVQMAMVLGLYLMSHISKTHQEAAVLADSTTLIPGFESNYRNNLRYLLQSLEQSHATGE